MVNNRKDWKTSQELMNELQHDPEYLRMRAEKEERHRRRREIHAAFARPILAKLAAHGFSAGSIEDAVKEYAPLPERLVGLLLESLPTCENDRVCESMVRALAAAAKPFDGRPLIRCYEKTKDDSFKWAIVNTIACARPHSIDEWLEKAREDEALRQLLEKLGYSW